MFKKKTKGWVPQDESNKQTVEMLHADEAVFLNKREAREDIGEDVKQVLLTVICEDVVKERVIRSAAEIKPNRKKAIRAAVKKAAKVRKEKK